MLRVIVAFGREDHEHAPLPRARASAPSTPASTSPSGRRSSRSRSTRPPRSGTALVLGFGAYHVLQGGSRSASCWSCSPTSASVYKPLEAISSTIGVAAGSVRRSADGLRPARQGAGDQGRAGRGDARPGPRAGRVRRRVASTTTAASDTLTDISFEARARRRWSPSSARPAPARPRSSACCRASTTPQAGPHPARRPRHPPAHPAVAARADQHRAAGAAAVLGDDRRQHPLRPARRDRRTRSSRRPRRPTRTTSSRPAATGTTRRSASAARSCPAASASASPSPGRSSRTRRS